MNAALIASRSVNSPEKRRPAKTKTFLIHSFGRPVLIAARKGERRGTTGSCSGGVGSAGTVGCSEVIVSIEGGRLRRRDRLPDRECGSRKGTAERRRPPSRAGAWAFVVSSLDPLLAPAGCVVALASPSLRSSRLRQLSRSSLNWC